MKDDSYMILRQAGRQDAFSDYLSSFIVKKEVEIERMCGLHYQVIFGDIEYFLIR